MLNLIDKIGDWNPQLFRELKGRLKPFPFVIALVTSLATQLIIFIYQLLKFPSYEKDVSNIHFKYCKSGYIKEAYSDFVSCPPNQIDIQLWWRDHFEYMFLSLSVIFIFTLLVAGTYLIINDLAQEERKGTLNFIRLSPQSEANLFTGKLLGVPALIYLAVIAAIPFHVLTGKLANIAFSYILLFYLIVVASCIFFYSIASLFGIYGGSAFSGFKPWLGSGLVLLFLWMTMAMSRQAYHNYIAFFRLFSPADITGYLFPNLFNKQTPTLQDLQFFNLALGKNLFSTVAIHLLNYAVWTYWVWQGLKRCFRNPNATIFSKQQSYLIVASFEIMILGFLISEDYSRREIFYEGIGAFYVWNLSLLLPFFALLLPHRQAIQDWARFRYHKNANSTDASKKFLFSELMLGEKSPAIVAIAINLLIAASTFIVLSLNASTDSSYASKHILLILSISLLFISLTVIYATTAQIMLMLKNSKRTLWAMGTTSAVIILPLMIFGIFNVQPHNILWQFTIVFWVAVKDYAESTVPNMCIAFLCQLIIIGLLNWYLIKQVKFAGESATKALFSQSNVI
ncbi:hypothetical protein [Rivularia sp. UHCC 0363]|uniref:hypothetical protein n=1 Tax=Rivularia sp. UHCC 0363 TaxID=3110244 RepID=UPI002B1F7631|nr:hypothetical protein [Rivularia sp. UHCC 0363]MEA5597057.1 hypothetical protein [Rivularia sp. UHCC 0363]